ncbi:Cactin [Balamuthia mandrillaris]
MGRSRKDGEVEEKKKKREKDREQKLLNKLLETPEERRKRRLKKKAEKQARKKKQEEEALGGYTNAANPFGDANLTEQFVWKLKREKELEKGVTPEELDARDERRRREDLRKELEKAKRRRQEREAEREQWEAERAQIARERESLNYEEWEKQEEQFHLEQARIRSEIRIREGRPKPIDILYKNLNMDADFEFEMEEPYKLFANLTLPDLQELQKDIAMYLDLDSSNEEHKVFWEALTIVCLDELEQAKARQANSKAAAGPRGFDGGVHKAVSDDIATILQGKTYDELCTLEQQIAVKLGSGNMVDPEYWETLLKRLVVYKAKAKLRDIHASLLRAKLQELQTKQHLEDLEEEEEEEEEQSNPTAHVPATATAVEDSMVLQSQAEERCYSPLLIHDIDQDEEILDPELDKETLEEQRQLIREKEAQRLQERGLLGHGGTDDSAASRQMYEMEASKLLDENEETFNQEMPLERQIYWWQDKYRPRKPRYFNRVHTGYEWNKYNQSHYDHDNPPPKIVQGYKFNIFYPDLIDKSKPPRYFIEPTDNPDISIIRFHAGPPYEDIAFKVVNREWE